MIPAGDDDSIVGLACHDPFLSKNGADARVRVRCIPRASTVVIGKIFDPDREGRGRNGNAYNARARSRVQTFARSSISAPAPA
jgi:hypothetical protein